MQELDNRYRPHNLREDLYRVSETRVPFTVDFTTYHDFGGRGDFDV